MVIISRLQIKQTIKSVILGQGDRYEKHDGYIGEYSLGFG